MLRQENIKKLIQKGFDLELISFELNIPIEQLRQYRLELQKERSTPKENFGQNSKEKQNPYVKIKQMREKYRKLYFGENTLGDEIVQQEEISEQDIEAIRKIIAIIENKIQEMKSLPISEKRGITINILSEMRNIKNYSPIPLNEAEKLYLLMCSEEIKKAFGKTTRDSLFLQVSRHKKFLATQLAIAIEKAERSIDSLEDLEKLSKKISFTMAKDYPMTLGTVNYAITARINAMKKKQLIDRINNIPESIMLIAKQLVDGKIDIQDARIAINEEVEKREQNKLATTKFSLNKEQERAQVLIQIRTAISEKSSELYIQDPMSTILKIQELCGGELGLSIRAVGKNLINHQDFERAKAICDEFSRKSKDDERAKEYIKYIRALRDEIRNSEIGNFIMRMLKSTDTLEAVELFRTVEKGLEMGNVKLEAISLGKDRDGIKTITLADIWQQEIKKEKQK